MVEERPLCELPFPPEGALLVVHVKARRVPGWRIEHGAAAAPPANPIVIGEMETVELLPYGCTNLRITELPITAPQAN